MSDQELYEKIRGIVCKELKARGHVCQLGVSASDTKAFENFVDMMKSLGHGELGNGISLIRDNHKWLYKQRQRSDKLSTVFFILIITTTVGGLISALWAGIRHMLGKG